MGSFDEHCFLTRTNIQYGDEVLVIRCPRTAERTREAIWDAARQGISNTDWIVAWDRYDDYGRGQIVEEPETFENPLAFAHRDAILAFTGQDPTTDAGFKELVGRCMAARVTIMHHEFGTQFIDEDAIKWQRIIAVEALRLLERQSWQILEDEARLSGEVAE